MVIRLTDAITDQQRDKISEVMQKVKICEDDPDVIKTPTGFCIVKFSDQFKSRMPCCNECFQSRCCTPQPPLEGTQSSDTASCSANCSSASYYAAALCASITGNRCRMACIAAVEPLRRACDWCCSTGDFYSSCAAPLLSFFHLLVIPIGTNCNLKGYQMKKYLLESGGIIAGLVGYKIFFLGIDYNPQVFFNFIICVSFYLIFEKINNARENQTLTSIISFYQSFLIGSFLSYLISST